ncbi:MAG: hypothetical protein H6922_01820 [Pseudomonadaceae bacterium]|nr:hypothetical protein [Pseudomonadaceae bacterium]
MEDNATRGRNEIAAEIEEMIRSFDARMAGVKAALETRKACWEAFDNRSDMTPVKMRIGWDEGLGAFHRGLGDALERDTRGMPTVRKVAEVVDLQSKAMLVGLWTRLNDLWEEGADIGYKIGGKERDTLMELRSGLCDMALVLGVGIRADDNLVEDARGLFFDLDDMVAYARMNNRTAEGRVEEDEDVFRHQLEAVSHILDGYDCYWRACDRGSQPHWVRRLWDSPPQQGEMADALPEHEYMM